MTKVKAACCARMSAIGIRQSSVHRMIDKIEQWEKTNGVDWTVRRLKDMKQMYICRMAGVPYKPSISIAVSPSGIPKGPFGCLWKGTTSKHHAKAINALMVYSMSISQQVTPRQWEKFRSSVEEPIPSSLGPSAYADMVRREFVACVLERRLKSQSRLTVDPIPLSTMVFSPGKRAPVQSGRTFPETEVASWLPQSCEARILEDLLDRYPSIFHPSTKAMVQEMSAGADYVPRSSPENVVGKISFIQEPGLKLRAVANPNRIVQHLLEPLKRNLLERLKEIPEDCTHDQGKGILQVQEWLKMGLKVHSVDLSDATNNFPLELQVHILSGLKAPGPWKESVQAFYDCSTAKWSVMDPLSQKQRQIQWRKGQPLGLGPSFPAFALSHHVVVRNAYSQSLGKGNKDPMRYVILGDDIVIASRNNHHVDCYRSMMSQLGCPVAPNKTISSDRLAEFGGRIITPDRIIPQAKWRSPSDYNFLEVTKSLGHQYIGSLPPRQRRVARILSEVPQEFGGLGFNPKGKPYETRVLENLDTIAALESQERGIPFDNTNSKLNELLLSNRLADLVPEFVRTHEYVGDPVIQRSRQTPNSTKWRILNACNVQREMFLKDETVPQGYYPTVLQRDPRGRSTLDVLESRLGIGDSGRLSPSRARSRSSLGISR